MYFETNKKDTTLNLLRAFTSSQYQNILKSMYKLDSGRNKRCYCGKNKICKREMGLMSSNAIFNGYYKPHFRTLAYK